MGPLSEAAGGSEPEKFAKNFINHFPGSQIGRTGEIGGKFELPDIRFRPLSEKTTASLPLDLCVLVILPLI